MKKKGYRKGYITVHDPNHPKAYCGFVYEHFLVAEKILNRQLRVNEQVHHLDFNPKNNMPENLLILEHGQHTRLHNFLRRHGLEDPFKNIGDGEYHVKECEYCNDYIAKLGNEKFCDGKCYLLYLADKKENRPSKAELEILLQTKNKVEIGEMYGVHRSTINLWLSDYEKADTV